jgi:hypothetical protein
MVVAFRGQTSDLSEEQRLTLNGEFTSAFEKCDGDIEG